MRLHQIIALVLSLNLIPFLNAQNLVVNGSFESYSNLPTGEAQWWRCNIWNNVNMSMGATATYATPDYYNEDAAGASGYDLPTSARGTISPHTGKAIMGLLCFNQVGSAYANFREYLSSQLASPMVVGQTYTVSFWLSNAEATTQRRYGSTAKGFGIHFSTAPLSQPTRDIISVTPQIEVAAVAPWSDDWTLHTFTYTATSAWQYITIGNFTATALQARTIQDASATYPTGSYYFIDDVSIESVGCATTASNSGDVCIGSNVDISTTAVTGATYSWTGPSGFTSSLQNIQGVTPPLTPGIYDYTVTVDNGASTCTSTTSITVNSIPTVDAGAYTPLCENDTDLALIGSPVGGAFSGTGVNGNNFSTDQGTQTITYSYTDVNGCANSDQTIITVNTLPNVNAGGDHSICLGSTITLNGTGAINYSWNNGAINGQTFTPGAGSTLYTLMGTDGNGCVNTDAVTITVNNPEYSTDVQVACGSFTWIDGVTYSSSNNSATFTIPGGATTGCDSIITLDLTINNTVYGTDTQVACESFTWIDGINYTSDNTTATFTIVGGSAVGCDSIVTLNLTIGKTIYSTDVQFDCEAFTWIDGNVYNSSNNTATHTLVGGSVLGCDSIVTLDLTIVNPSLSTDTHVACDTFTWINGVNYSSSNNTAIFTITGGASTGCDSIILLDLTIYTSPVVDLGDDISICDDSTLLSANSNFHTYLWSNGSNSPSITVIQEGIYSLYVTDLNGCSGFDDVLVSDDCLFTIWVPNSFTPDGNQFNQVFIPVVSSKEFTNYSFLIFDRWGELIFESRSIDVGWDGTLKNRLLQDGVYVWKISLDVLSNNERQEYVGHVNLLK